MSYSSTYHDYIVAIDLGQKGDYTAIAALEQPIWCNSKWDPHRAIPDGWVSPGDHPPEGRDYLRALEYKHRGLPYKPELLVRHLQRFPLGTSYPKIVEDVARLLARDPLNHGTALLVDATGVGAPVVDLFRHHGLRPVAITITGGREVHPDGMGNFSVPKRDIVLAAQVALQGGRLKIAETLPDAPVLVRELAEFKSKISDSGHDTYGPDAWREKIHDDLVLALGMAVWFREFWCEHLDAALVARPKVLN